MELLIKLRANKIIVMFTFLQHFVFYFCLLHCVNHDTLTFLGFFMSAAELCSAGFWMLCFLEGKYVSQQNCKKRCCRLFKKQNVNVSLRNSEATKNNCTAFCGFI